MEKYKERGDRKNLYIKKYLCFSSLFFSKKGIKKGKFTAQPAYPCFGQDLGDSEGAGNLPIQRWGILLNLKNTLSKFILIQCQNAC